MVIKFKKQADKPSILTCIRDDGTMTWVQMYQGIEAHDLGHYAVERTLGFQNAFYGLVAKGQNIADFELPRHQRPPEVMPKNLHNEALVTEHLVNLMMTKAQTDDESLDVLKELQGIISEKQLSFPENLTEEKMTEIWTYFKNLLNQWARLKEGETLEFEF